MRHVVFAWLMVVLAVVADAQPPATPPAALPAKSTGKAGEPPLAKFTPLAAFPQQTQDAVRGVVLGADWMTRMNQPQGRFLFGYHPALRRPMLGDDDLTQARATLALARAAKFSGDEKQTAMAGQAILSLLAATRIDPTDANCRVPVHSSLVCNRVGFASLLVLAIHELPGADAKRLAEAEQLVAFLKKQCQADGSVDYTDSPTDDPAKTDPEGLNEYPGLALAAILASHRAKPEAWKLETAKKGMAYYRAAFRAKPHPMLAATLTPACADLYLQAKAGDAAATAFEMNDWLCGLQIAASDPRMPQWAGGFRAVINGRPAEAPPGPETGLLLGSLAHACRLTRLVPDAHRYAKYRVASIDAVQFLTGMQYLETNTRHFDNTFRVNMLIGGFHLSPTDGDLRIDATAHAVSGLVKFLESGAER
jgi:hypothetical protein